MMQQNQNPIAIFQQMAGNDPRFNFFQQLIYENNGRLKNQGQIEQIAKNMAKQNGFDLNKFFNQFGIKPK